MAKVQRTRTEPPHHKTRLVRNFSGRNGAPIQAIAIHSTESNDIANSRDDLAGVRAWFDNPASQASSHLGVDGDGHAEVWVPESAKAWTILQLNPVTLNIEMVGRAAQPKSAWERAQIKKAAKFVAYWSIKYGLPIQRGKVRAVNGWPVISKKGVIRHSDLTNAGFGSHTDPGANFPMADLLKAAQWYRKNGWER